MSEIPCDDPQCCCNAPLYSKEEDFANAIELDHQDVLKYLKKYGNYGLAIDRAAIDHYKRVGDKKAVKRRKQILRYQKKIVRRLRREGKL